MQRKFNAYEINHLRKFGVDHFSIGMDSIGSKPVEYITGHVEFCGLDFIVNKNVLIPRIETERIIDIAFENIKKIKDKKRIKFCDVGTGSGCIGLSFAKKLDSKRIQYEGILSDKSEEVLECTKMNHESIGFNGRIEIIRSDLFSNYPRAQKFDVILANLPYVPTKRVKDLDSSVKNYEPILALDGGDDGLMHIRKLIDQVQGRLEEGGFVLLEVDDTHTHKVAQEFEFGWEIEVFTDINDKNRFWLMSKR
jgi:release factor glutamine methyltransferase